MKKMDEIQKSSAIDGGGKELLEQIFNEQKALLDKVESIQSNKDVKLPVWNIRKVFVFVSILVQIREKVDKSYVEVL